VNQAVLPITGYLDRFSARPGEDVVARISLGTVGPYRVRLVRVICGDPNPDGPGMQFEDLSARLDRTLQGRRQPIHLGSYGLVPKGPARSFMASCTWTVLVWTAHVGGAATLFSDGHLRIGSDSAGVFAELAGSNGPVRINTDVPLRPRQWHRVWLSADPSTGQLVIGQQAAGSPDIVQASDQLDGLRLPSAAPVMFAADTPSAPRHHFTGKLEAPAILAGFVTDWSAPLPPVLAAWDFSIGIPTQVITDTGPNACHGHLVNIPNRGMVGAGWTGKEMCWRHKPQDYAAIQFHDGDLDDCGWAADLTWTVPPDMPSGAYALHLTCNEGQDHIPFYVLPNRTGPFASVVFLASTFTYQAYANHARGNADASYKARATAWGASPYNPDDYPIYGRSTYNRHADNSGISISSRRRPILTMRPGFLTFDDARGSGLRHYPADTHLLAWLEAKGIPFDVITDEDLDNEGPALLAPYRVVLTGSHPEYHTPGTLDALQRYTDNGGKLAYLGGNGFYWRVARVPELPHIIELRRAEGGIRAWQAEPGEYYHQLDGQYGGLWRRNRRPPQMLAGVGFSGQGKFEGTYYRRLPASYDPNYAWMFAGIDGEIIGDYGLSGGGAAGFELDRADPVLGTPTNAVILARSENPPASFVTVPEELLSHLHTVSGEEADALMRGEIVYFDTESGGAVFAVGSITFCGSLWNPAPANRGFNGPVSCLLENVVRKFAGQT
jgi:N,N-dimethylformamidase